MVCFSNVLLLQVTSNAHEDPIVPLGITVLLLVIGKFLPPGALKLIYNPLRGVISLWGPLVGILLLGPCLASEGMVIPRIIFALQIAVVSLLTISRLRFPMIIKLETENSSVSRRLLIWRPVVLTLCMSTAMVLSVYLSPEPDEMIESMVLVLLVVSFSSLQFPAAVVRLMLAVWAIAELDCRNNGPHRRAYCGEFLEESDVPTNYEHNLVPSLKIFYGLVLVQGILYTVACILECFSFIPRRSLVCRAGFRDQWGVKSVNMYYTYAYEKCMEASVLAPKNMDLTAFAMDCLNSDSPNMQLYGVRMLHGFLKEQAFKIETISKLTASTKTVTTLFSMLGWTSKGDTDIRLFATKVTAELAGSLRVVAIPGTMQFISSLLDSDHQPKRQNPLLEIDSQEEEKEPLREASIDEQNSQILKCWQQMTICWSIPEESSFCLAGQDSCILRRWQKMTKFWSIPEEDPLTDHDLLPVLGISILESLADCDHDICVEISRATGLISKIIGFTSYRSEITNTTEVQQKVIGSSLKVLQRLSGTGGEIGMALRQSISEHPFLLNNLAEILDDNGSSKLWKLVIDILRNLAMDGNTRQEIGHIQLIISRLMNTFLSRDASPSANSDHLIRKLAGQALTMLAIESTDNCLAMLKEPGYVFIKELTIMIHDVRYRYVAASLLRNLCVHARPGLSNSDLRELSHALPQVLEGIMEAEGGELEILIGLSSQISSVIPNEFDQELEHGQIKEGFVKRLVDVLKANMKPTAHCPGMRRVIIEQAIYMMEYNSHYANCFKDCWMMEALTMVERTPTKAEKYRLFLGDCGLMEYSTLMSNLVTRAKQLMTVHSTWQP